MTGLNLKDACVSVKGAALLDGVSLSLGRRELVVVLGPNGAGKTTLLRAAIGLQTLDAGAALIDAAPATGMPPAERARKVAYLPQHRPLAWPVTVRDVVALGRFAHGARLGALGEQDKRAVDKALADCGLGDLADRRADTLSGGEAARMHCARAFAAEAPLLIADEPVAALDPRHQLAVAELLRAFVDAGGGALVVLHDIDLAARIADRLVWMKAGRIVADGPVRETLVTARIEAVFGVTARLVDGRPVIDGMAGA